jgi:hypothetical protein
MTFAAEAVNTYFGTVAIPSLLIAVSFVAVCVLIFVGALSAWLKATRE